MRLKVFCLVALAGLFLTAPALGQTPSTGGIDPQMAEQLLSRLRSSGLTPAQIRARLQAEGYPSTLLDAYLGESVGQAAVPNDQVFSAVRSLGLVDSLAIDSIRTGRARPARDRVPRDPVLERVADSLGVSVDSIDVVADSLTEDVERRLEAWRELRDRASRARRVVADSGQMIFGLHLFQDETTQFDANLAGPVDPNYRLGPGDQLVLILTGDVEAAHELPVTREGFVVIPQVGQISVANLTLGQLEDVLYSRLRSVYSGIGRGPGASTRFAVSVARLRSNQVYVVGDVVTPGSYRVSSAGTAMTALYAAGGPTENGNLRAVEVRRGGEIVGTLDLYDYLLQGNAAEDPRLQSGDVVFVPARGPRVRVWGEVIRPATYELVPGETLQDLLRSAGGFTARADRRRVQIERILPPSERSTAGSDRIVIDVNSSELATGYGPAVPLHAGDVVRVFEIPERLTNQVTVNGNVWTPGRVAFRRGMRLSDALRQAGGLKPDSYLGHVLVSRLQPDSTRIQLRASLADTTGQAIEDIHLEDADEIRVFSQTEFRPRRYVVVSGAVRRGGRVPYREGMTLRDLVLLAGGLEESALLNEAEIARMPETRAAGTRAVTTRVPLDSSYLFERGHDGSYDGPPGLPARSGGAPEILLQPYDHVLIFRQPEWSLPQSVVITGEVERPGRYTLRSKTERLSDLVDRAGGVTSEAYPGGVVFVRSHRDVGRIGIDLSSVLRDANHRDNLLLLDGDSIAVPMYSSVVHVRGAVNAPVAVAHVPGANLEYYVNAAGGATPQGDAKRTFVTQPNGKVEARRGRGILPDAIPEPRPGAQVFVPNRDPLTSRNWAALATTTAQVLGSLVGVIAILTQL